MKKENLVKRISASVLLTAMLVLSVTSFAAESKAAQPKIAVIDIQNAVVSTDKAKGMIKKLEAEPDYKEAKDQATKLQASLEATIEEAKRDSATWTDAQREEAGKKVANKKADLEHLVRKIQAQNKQLVQMMMQEMGQDIQAALREIVDKEGITLLLEKQFVMHVDPTYDLTTQLTAKLNSPKK